MNVELVNTFARRLGTSVRAATDRERNTLSAAGVSEPFGTILYGKWFSSYSDIDGLEIYDLESICEELKEDDFRQLTGAGYLPIGKGGNGDSLVVVHSDPNFPVGFVRLGRELDPRPNFALVSHSLRAFLERGSKRPSILAIFRRQPRFPRDYYEAKDQTA